MSLWRAHRDFGFLHEFQEIGLHSAPADIAPGKLAGRGDLVDFVNVNDAVLGALDIPIRASNQIPHQILDVTSHIAGFGELGGVGLYKRNANEIGDAPDEVGFAHTGRSQQDNILLGVVRLFPALGRQSHMMVVIAQGHAQDLLGLGLLNDKTIQVRLDVSRFPVEGQRLLASPARLLPLARPRPPQPETPAGAPAGVGA